MPLSAKKAEALAEKSRGTGWFGNRRWNRLWKEALAKDAEATTAVISVASDDEHPRNSSAKWMIAEMWFDRREPSLRKACKETRAVASKGMARLASAALSQQLSNEWDPLTDRELRALLSDEDPDVPKETLKVLSTVKSTALDPVWGIYFGSDTFSSQDAALTKSFETHISLVRRTLLERTEPPTPQWLAYLWDGWLSEGPEELTKSLRRWNRLGGTTTSSRIAAGLLLKDASGLQASDPRTLIENLVAFGSGKNGRLKALSDAYLSREATKEMQDILFDLATTSAEARDTCVRLKLAPVELDKRVKFYVLTNQPEMYRQVDLDGSMMALIYDAAGEGERQRLRKALLAFRGLNIVQTLIGADRRTRILQMTREEREYLTEQLVEREEWGELWSLALELPLATATNVVRKIDRFQWRPSNPDDASLFDTFHQVEPFEDEYISHLFTKYLPPAVQVATVRFHGRVNDLAFAPSEPEIAVGGTARVAGIVDLQTGTLKRVRRDFDASVGRVLHLGNDLIVVAERTSRLEKECGLYEWEPEDVFEIATSMGSITSLARSGEEGYVAGSRSGTFWIRNWKADITTQRTLTNLGLDEHQWPRSIACSADGLYVGFIGRSPFMTDEKMRRVVSRSQQTGFAKRALITVNNDLLFAQENGRLAFSKGNEPAKGAILENGRIALPKGSEPAKERFFKGLGGIAYVPSRRQVIYADTSGALHFIDDTTLEGVSSTEGSNEGWMKATSLTTSETGDFLAVGYAVSDSIGSGFNDGHVEIYDGRVGEVAAMLDRPMASAVPAQLSAVGLIEVAKLPPILQPIISLLKEALEHRFRYDIGITRAASLSAGEFDIFLEEVG